MKPPPFAQSNSRKGGQRMEQDKLWAAFQKSGKVEDYLRYCGIDTFNTGTNAVLEKPPKEGQNETDNRRTDHSRK